MQVCSCLEVGSLTPSPGLVNVISTNVSIPCFALVRPRAGDFVYSDLEFEAMCYDIEELLNSGAKGLVLGCLDPQRDIDLAAVKKLIKIAMAKSPGVELTFHRAIDMSKDILKTTKTVRGLGFVRILTSGGHANVMEGAGVIKKLRGELRD